MKRSMFILALLLGLFLMALPSTAHAQYRSRGYGYAGRGYGYGYGVRGYGYGLREYGPRYVVPRYYGPRVGIYVNPAPAPVFYGYEQVWDPYLQQYVSVPIYWYPNYGYYGYWRGGVFFRWGRR